MPEKVLTVIGGGLAGSEAAWQAAGRGARVRLFEMRPVRMTPAHNTPFLAELVCSNSLRSSSLTNAVGLLKEEMRRLGSLVMRVADDSAVPAGSALAVDREAFAGKITAALEAHPGIEVVREEAAEVPDGTVILATGPLTSDAMAKGIAGLAGGDYLYFYDAIAPIVDAESVDMSVAFRASRWGKGGDDYVNCPMDEAGYRAFWDALLSAEKAPVRDFESLKCFEGCKPVEVIAESGPETLRHGPMKPFGIIDPRTGKQPFAVVQLRMEDSAGTAYNLVGFQTRLKWPEQERVFRMIPGLEGAEFIRFGSLHRNTFINGPASLTDTLEFKNRPGVFCAGQLSGVEGYVESAATGLLAGITAARLMAGLKTPPPPPATAHGALIAHLTKSDPAGFQPSNVIFSLFPPLDAGPKKKAERREAMASRALSEIDRWKRGIDEQPAS